VYRLKRVGAFEKCFGHDGKEFGWIGCPVSVEQTRNSALIGPTKCIELFPHYPSPSFGLVPGRQCRYTICGIILKIELMRKLMQDDVAAIGWVGGYALRCIPCQDEGSEPVLSMAEEKLPAFFPDRAF